jgi:hypothetical protein
MGLSAWDYLARGSLVFLSKPLEQASVFRKQPNSQNDWDNRPTVSSQDAWDNRPTGQQPERLGQSPDGQQPERLGQSSDGSTARTIGTIVRRSTARTIGTIARQQPERLGQSSDGSTARTLGTIARRITARTIGTIVRRSTARTIGTIARRVNSQNDWDNRPTGQQPERLGQSSDGQQPVAWAYLARGVLNLISHPSHGAKAPFFVGGLYESRSGKRKKPRLQTTGASHRYSFNVSREPRVRKLLVLFVVP